MVDTITYRKILQIIPANNWFAAHTKQEEDGVFYIPLACFALCECEQEMRVKDTGKWEKMKGTHQEVCPMTGGGIDKIDFCEDNGNYEGIVLLTKEDDKRMASIIT